MCVCGDVHVFSTWLRIAILQHPAESRRTISTARIVSLSVAGCRHFVGVDFTGQRGFSDWIDPAAGPAYLVYPEPDAWKLDDLVRTNDGWPRGRPLFVLLDGTWSQARKIKNQNPLLAGIPRVALAADRPSEYRIRKQPRDGCLSTVEAAALLLSHLDPQAPAGQMLETFRRMIERMLPFKQSGDRPRFLGGTDAPGLSGP
jgi:DTW domain-containing protein YfiP